MSPAGTDENGNYYILTYDHQSETFVRKTEDGQTLATLNLESGQWEEVEAQVEQVTAAAEIQTNIDTFMDMSQAEFDEKVEELCFHRGVENPGLGFVVTTIGGKGSVEVYGHRTQGVLLGIQQVKEVDNNKDVLIAYWGVEDFQGNRVIIPTLLGEPSQRHGYHTVDFKYSGYRTLTSGYTEKLEPLNQGPLKELDKRMGDVIVFNLLEYKGLSSLGRESYIIKLLESGSITAAAEIARQLQGESPIPDFFDQFKVLGEEVKFEDLIKLPLGSNFFMSEQIGSFLPQ